MIALASAALHMCTYLIPGRNCVYDIFYRGNLDVFINSINTILCLFLLPSPIIIFALFSRLFSAIVYVHLCPFRLLSLVLCLVARRNALLVLHHSRNLKPPGLTLCVFLPSSQEAYSNETVSGCDRTVSSLLKSWNSSSKKPITTRTALSMLYLDLLPLRMLSARLRFAMCMRMCTLARRRGGRMECPMLVSWLDG